MKKSSIVTMMAVLLSLGFCVLSFGLFARISETSSAPADSLEVTVTPGTQPESAAPVISDDQGSSSLSWIQAGVFARESSVRELTAFLEQDGFTPVTYTRGEYKIVAVGVSLDPEVTRQCRQRMIDLDYEWMERACSLNETQRQQLSQGQTASVLEGCTSQP